MQGRNFPKGINKGLIITIITSVSAIAPQWFTRAELPQWEFNRTPILDSEI